MFTLIFENAKGEAIQLSQNPRYTVTSITGLNPPLANINTAINASFDGSTFKSSRLDNRNIVITLAIEGDIKNNRVELYKYVKAKDACKVRFSNGVRNVYIDGYVEALECNLFEQRQLVQISVICPNPYFKDDGENNVFSSVNGLFEFPFAIDSEGIPFGEIVINEDVNVFNAGDVATGMLIEFKAADTVVNPAIYNMRTNEFIKLSLTMETGDVVQINTVRGQKSVTKISGGVKTNILNTLAPSSTWLVLESGDNIMLFTADTHPENLSCTVRHNNLYEGV